MQSGSAAPVSNLQAHVAAHLFAGPGIFPPTEFTIAGRASRSCCTIHAGGMCPNIEVQDSPPMMLDDEETVEDAERQGGNGESHTRQSLRDGC
jgi:hypothetical protein